MPESEIPGWLTAFGPAALPWAVVFAALGGHHIRRKWNGGTINERLARLETKVDLIMAAMKLTPKD